ncbi:ankyrin repeat-containing domain protein [Aspergillus similis]
MAEVGLGIAGSVAGVPSLAGQICVGLQKLNTFLDSIKEVQSDLRCVKDDIPLLENVVLDMSNDCMKTPEDLDNSLSKTSFGLCIYRIERLLEMIQPLENTAQKSKSFQAICATVRKKRLAEFAKEFDGVKKTLLLVHQHYMRKSTSRSLPGAGRRLAPTSNTSHGSAVQLALTDTNSTNNEKIRPCIKQPGSTRRAAYQKQFQFLFGVLSIKSEFSIPLNWKTTSTNNVQHENEKKIFQLRFAQWLRLGIIELQALKQRGSWTYQLRHYHITPSDSLLFQLCSDGDLRNVQCLFSKCLVSPFDVSPNGQTVLHYAARSGSIELVKFLLQIGVDANAETIKGENALEYAMTSGHEETYYELARLFVYRGQVDPMKQGSRASILHSYDGPPEAFRYLILQDQFSIDPEERNSQGKTILHYQILHRIYYGESWLQVT